MADAMHTMHSEREQLSESASSRSEDPAASPGLFGPLSACGILIIYTLVYVLPLYGSTATRPSPTLSRDDPAVIRARIRSVRSSTTVCLLSTFLILLYFGQGTIWAHLHAMGFWPVGFRETLATLTLTGTLFAGPLYETLFIDGWWRDMISTQAWRQTWTSLITWRNIVVGPVTEELLFRSAAVPLFLLARLSMVKTIFLTPVIFGLAHIHHFYEFRITHPRVPLAAAVARSVMQFTYTTLFGAYATYLFIRTGSLLAAVAAHAFCNAMGLPRVWGRVEPYWLSHLSSDIHQKACLKWTVIYYIILVLGAWGWWQGLEPLTSSDMALFNVTFRA
ncbi:CAAX prenyl protease [Plectosphaerella plurivora]|uniref:intramembrane prenyl-peptidase Rce1 n=1 Tax=Plectosphaerella plurivora TaxID=936078 RepID=A0A9P8V476_9PEZI|nr:CAAX prenyl protease [Plectosphaerella plurivora]